MNMDRDTDYTVVCISDFCKLYNVRQQTMEVFGLLNEVHSVDKDAFERLKGLIARKREPDDIEQASKRVCGSWVGSQGPVEGSTLEVPSQDILWSQQDAIPELLISEGTENPASWEGTVTLLESEQPINHLLLHSEDMHSSSPPPMTF